MKYMKLKMILGQMELACFLLGRQKVRQCYLILSQSFTIFMADFSTWMDILLFVMMKLLLELLEKNQAFRTSLQNFSGQVQTVLLHLHFLLPCCCFLPKKKNPGKKFFFTEFYKNLTVEVLSSYNSENLQFDALTDLCAELGVWLRNSIFANHERARLDMKKQTGNKQKIWFFWWWRW